MYDVIGHAKRHLIVVQYQQKYYVDEKWQEVFYEVDQQMFVRIANIQLKVPCARKL